MRARPYVVSEQSVFPQVLLFIQVFSYSLHLFISGRVFLRASTHIHTNTYAEGEVPAKNWRTRERRRRKRVMCRRREKNESETSSRLLGVCEWLYSHFYLCVAQFFFQLPCCCFFITCSWSHFPGFKFFFGLPFLPFLRICICAWYCFT